MAKSRKSAKVRVVKYIRVSALMGRDDEHFLSPEIQEHAQDSALDRTFGKGQWETVAVKKDIDVSGVAEVRAGFDESIAIAREGGADAISVYDSSRWSRDVGGGIHLLQELQEQYEIRIVSGREGELDVTSATGELHFGMLALMNRWKWREVSDGWQRTIAARARNGKWHGPRPPVGYFKNEEGGLTVDEEKAPIIKHAFVMAADISVSIYRVHRYLTENGVEVSNVYETLRNPIYTGVVRHHATRPHPTRRDKKGRPVRVRTGEYEDFPGLHESIVPNEVFDAVQARINANVKAGLTFDNKPSHELVGVAACALCGAALVRNRANGDTAYLTCANQRRHGRGPACTGAGAARLDDLIKHVYATICDDLQALANDSDAAGRANAKAGSTALRSDDVAALEKRLGQVQEAQANAEAERLINPKGRSTVVHEKLMQKLQDEENKLLVRIARARSANDRVRFDPKAELDILALWEAADVDERNRMLRELAVRVEVRKSEYRLEPYSSRSSVTAPWLPQR